MGRICRIGLGLEATQLFTNHVKLELYVRRGHTSPFWMESDLMHLKEKAVVFKVLELSAFNAYHSSSMSPWNWHLLDNSVDAIRKVGGI